MRQQLNLNNKVYAKKSLGQNFITDKKFLNTLSDIISFNSNADVIEIGPGKGALTDKIIKKKYNKLFLIEKDDELCNSLQLKYKNKKNINIIHKDALKIDISKISSNKETIIIGNLPFNISSQLLINWISYNEWPPFYSRMYLMFQYELGKRIVSKKNNKRYGKISVLVQSRCEVRELIKAPSNIFDPKPKVNGLVLEIIPHNKIKNLEFVKLKRILNIAFNTRRKKIKNTLHDYNSFFENWDKIKDLRPENLDISEFCDLSKRIN